MGAETILQTCRVLVDARLDELLPQESEPPAELHRAMRYAALAEGKRLRPALCLRSASAVGGSEAAALDAACAVELVHTFSLIHDDLPAIDDDPMRRGRPSVHIEFGEALAILAGDALFALAFQALSRAEGPADARFHAVRVLADASGSAGLVGGEVMDVLAEGTAPGRELIEAIHRRKTAALMSASCALGGLFGGASEPQLDALREFGTRLGLAFQITDDVLNETSTALALGKSAGSDRTKGKATYPGVFGIEVSKRLALEHVDAAKASLQRASIESAELVALADYAVARDR